MMTIRTFLIVALIISIFSGCSDRYQCKCIDNFHIDTSKGNITGLNIVAANVVASQSNSFRILVDNPSKTWDHIDVKLFNDDQVFLETNEGLDFLQIRNNFLVMDIPTSSLNANQKPVLGEVKYQFNLDLGEKSIQLEGSIGVISCDNFYEDFDPIDCRWSCQVLQNGFEPGHCIPECPL
ncbi:MAG: hypothetical protein AAGA77_08015 [Bacteroidota bacterium]